MTSKLLTGEVAGFRLKVLAHGDSNLPTPQSVEPANCVPPTETGLVTSGGRGPAEIRGYVWLLDDVNYAKHLARYITTCPTVTSAVETVTTTITNSMLPAPAIEGAQDVAAVLQETSISGELGGYKVDSASTELKVVGVVDGVTVLTGLTYYHAPIDVDLAVALFEAQRDKLTG